MPLMCSAAPLAKILQKYSHLNEIVLVCVQYFILNGGCWTAVKNVSIKNEMANYALLRKLFCLTSLSRQTFETLHVTCMKYVY